MAVSKFAAKLGSDGEEQVVKFLLDTGAKILARNWRIREGEIDVVAQAVDGKMLFVEVKTRSGYSYGDPLESITPAKADRLQRLALAWLAIHQRLGAPYRIDGAAVLLSRSGEWSVDYREQIL